MTSPPPIVLYVDDELPNRIVFEQSLGDDFTIRTAPDARTALDILATIEVAVLITDQRMPEMSGDQLLRVVKQRWPTTIRMVITAYSDLEPILSAVNEGLVARYMIKPWARDEVVQVLRWAIEAWTFGKESATLQRRLLETERLATLGSIAGAVVHDINQPLLGLILNTERLVELGRAAPLVRALLDGVHLSTAERRSIAALTEDLPEIAAEVRASAAHLRELTAGLSQFLHARPADSGAVATDPMPIIKNAIAVCQDLATRARGLIGYDGVRELPRVRMPATELTQVLINLVANAAQALAARDRAGGHVTVLARFDDTAMTFEIRDDGVGMPPDVLARIGTPFFTTRREGIGLGVAQCQRLVGKSGGAFRIVSDAGVGTTVTFTLPLAT